MHVIEKIWNHPLYAKYYQKLAEAEKERIFCCHQIGHLLDVARIAYIQNLEQKLGIRKEVIYGAAFLHDIGKYRQYSEGIPHEKASAEIAEVILNEAAGDAFSEGEKASILRAVLGHRRLREDMEALKGGDLYEVARVAKSLVNRDQERGLSTGERKMLRTAKQILISEVVLSTGEDYQDIENQVNKAMSGGRADEEALFQAVP